MWTCMQWSRKDIVTMRTRKDIVTMRTRKDIVTMRRRGNRAAWPLWGECVLLLLLVATGLHNYQVNAEEDIDKLKFQVIHNEDPWTGVTTYRGLNNTKDLKEGDVLEWMCEFRAAVNLSCPGYGIYLEGYEAGNVVKFKVLFVSSANFSGKTCSCKPRADLELDDTLEIKVDLTVDTTDVSPIIHKLIESSPNDNSTRHTFEKFKPVKEAMKPLKNGQLHEFKKSVAKYKRRNAGVLTVEGIVIATKEFVETQKKVTMTTKDDMVYSIKLGEKTLKLECEYKPNVKPPVLLVLWYHNKTMIFGSNFTLNEKYNGAQINDPSLFIQDVAHLDQGLYECSVKNWVDTVKIKMKVLIAPEPRVEEVDDTDYAITFLVFGCVLIVGGMCLVSWSSSPARPPKPPPPPPPPPPPEEEEEEEEGEEGEEGEG